MNKDNCIFCKIVAGEIPSVTLYEDDHVLAFLDIGPISDGHSLLIPKEHVEFMDQASPDAIAQLARRLPMLAAAVKNAMNADGYNILNNNGKAAGQAVGHIHFHIIPRRQGDNILRGWNTYQYPDGKAQEIAENIRKNIKNP